MRNSDVARSWSNGKAAATANLHTDGKTLWSYNLIIGETVRGDIIPEVKIVHEYRSGAIRGFVSQTTSKHVGLAMRYADKRD